MKPNDSFSAGQAESSLQEIFEACDTTPDAASIESLAAHGKKQILSIHLLKAALVILFLLVALTPIILISPDLDISEQMNADSLTLTVRTDSLWPIRSVTVTLDGNELSLTRTDDAWEATIPRNGSVTVSASTIFSVKNSVTHDYTGIPVLLPELTDYRFENGQLIATFSAGTNPINYTGIRAEDEDGTYTPVSADESTGKVVFDLTGKDITIFVPDTEGNEFQIYLTPKS